MKTAIRTLEIFETFAELRRPLTLTELASALSTPVSTCFGLVRALESKGYLQPFGDRKELYPTRRMLLNAQITADHEPVLPLFRQSLEALCEATRETVILGQMTASGNAVLYLDLIEGLQTVRYTAKIGDLKPVHSSAIGKTLLASMSAEQLAATLRKIKLHQVTTNTLTSAEVLRADLALGRERGYQMTRGENVADVAAIAAPVRVGGRVFGIAVAGPLQRMDSELVRHARALQIAVANVEGTN